MHRRQWGYSLAIALALAGIGLKIFQWYHSRTLWLDEEMIFLNVRDRTWSQLAGPLWLGQTAPLGWLALERATLQMFGADDRAIRALAVLFGAGTLTCATWVALRWMRPAGAALFVLLCGLGQWMTHYALEAKPYSADAFWALLLPLLAVWATESEHKASTISLRRTLVWWITATCAQWISYGALFVAPGCAVLLCANGWLRGGRRRALMVALQGIPWLVSFGAHYYLMMRHARASAFLTNYWASSLPPKGSTLAGILMWLGQQAKPLADHPGGTTLWLLFWLVVAYGLVISFRTRPVLALALLLVPLSACVLGATGLVPLTDRLAFWILPALYAAVAFAADDSIVRIDNWLTRRTFSTLMVAGLTVFIVWRLSADIVLRGREAHDFRQVDNHGLDDKAAMRFLMAQRQSGDVLLATRDGLPAVWWYGGISIADPNAGRRYPADGAPIIELTYARPSSSMCRKVQELTRLQRALAGARRAAVHLGFHSDFPAGFQELVLDSFSEFSRLVSFKAIASEGAVAIFDLASAPEPSTIAATKTLWHRSNDTPRLDGCVGTRPARRW